MSELTASRKWVAQVLKTYGLRISAEQPLHYTIEATACYHYPVLLAWEGKPSVVNPNMLKAGRRKTDDIDSRTLAEMDLDQRWPASYVFPPDQMGLRVLLRMHHRFSRLANVWTLSLNSQLLKFGVTLSRLGSIQASTIRPVVEDLFHGKVPLVSALRDCVPEKNIPAWLSPHLERLYTSSDEAEATAKALFADIKSRLPRTFYWAGGVMQSGVKVQQLLETIPGVGPLTSLWMMAEIGDVRRFPTSNALAAWAGCDLSLRVSAGKVTSYVRRRGHDHIHWMVIQAAQAAMRSDNPLGMWGYRRIKKGGKGARQRAVGAVARRICVGVYWVLLKGEEWQPTIALKECTNDEAKVKPAAKRGPAGDVEPGAGTGGARNGRAPP